MKKALSSQRIQCIVVNIYLEILKEYQYLLSCQGPQESCQICEVKKTVIK